MRVSFICPLLQTDVCSRAKGVPSVDVVAQPGRGIGRDISHGEAVEKELDRLISKRASQDRRPDPAERDALWQESSARFNARRREENRQAWADFHEGQAERLRRTMEPLIAFHEARAEKYAHQPKGAT